MSWLTNPETWIALVTLTALEIVLGVDNVIFVSVLASKLPRHQQARARRIGMLGAMFTRIALLFSLAWLARLTTPLFTTFGHEISGRDLILLGGGLFLLAKATWEIHENLEGGERAGAEKTVTSFASLIVQIMLLDIVFSLDSVITAIGMARQIGVMVAAVVVAVGVMLWASGPIAAFVDRHPTVKILALSFLLLIGFSLVAEGLDQHVSKGYIYFAMGFSVFVEMLNLRVRKLTEPVHLQRRMPESD
jgi:predicted tellurium resistance membrane protein TerC